MAVLLALFLLILVLILILIFLVLSSSSRCLRGMTMIRVTLPYHLCTLARVDSEVQLEVAGQATLESVLDALEIRYPVLRGTVRDPVTGRRRPLLRFFACEQDLSHEPMDTPLPEAVTAGREPLMVVGAVAGG